jgi:hypothetical protein
MMQLGQRDDADENPIFVGSFHPLHEAGIGLWFDPL